MENREMWYEESSVGVSDTVACQLQECVNQLEDIDSVWNNNVSAVCRGWSLSNIMLTEMQRRYDSFCFPYLEQLQTVDPHASCPVDAEHNIGVAYGNMSTPA